jgi:RHS repeat-associated protein
VKPLLAKCFLFLDTHGYRYKFQGQEKDPETGKEAFELRLWDGRIGRWLTTDPAGQYSSPYLGMGNNPITRVDPDGGFDVYQKQEDGSFKWVRASEDIVFLDVDGSEITSFSGISVGLDGIKIGEDYADAMSDIFQSGEVSFNDYDEVATYNFGMDVTEFRSAIQDLGPSPKMDKVLSNLKLAKRADKVVDVIRSSKGLLKKAQLPVRGKIRFVPRAADIKNGAILQKHGGYVDKFGNVWKKPKGSIIGERHWDVQLSEIGKQRMGWLSNSGKHICIYRWYSSSLNYYYGDLLS